MEDPKLDSLRPGSREMEIGRWEGQNVQLQEVQRLEEGICIIPSLVGVDMISFTCGL
jgi:hypothetical protein